MTKKILVWGVGWLGFPLVKSLKEYNHKVICITRNAEKKQLLSSNFLDVFLVGELRENLGYLSECDVFILTIPPSIDAAFNDALSLILSSLSPDCHVIYTSSTGIYKNSNGLIDETAELDLKSSVFQTEDFLHKQSIDNLSILRLGGLIGPKRHPVHFLAKKEINSNPDQVVNLIQQEDVIEVILRIIETKTTGIFNVCSSEHPVRKEYYNSAAKVFGLNSLSFENDEHQSGKIVDTKKLRGLFPNITFTSIYDFEKCR